MSLRFLKYSISSANGQQHNSTNVPLQIILATLECLSYVLEADLPLKGSLPRVYTRHRTRPPIPPPNDAAMAHPYYPESLSAIPGCSNASTIGDENSYGYISVQKKLLFLKRPEFVEWFEALRDGNSINEDVDWAVYRLRKASLRVGQRKGLMRFVARRLWPKGSWQTWSDPSYFGIYLRVSVHTDQPFYVAAHSDFCC